MPILDLKPYDPEPGDPADANEIANAFTVTSTVVNNLDDTNVAVGAALAPSKLAGFPNDGTKMLRGDGTWGSTSGGALAVNVYGEIVAPVTVTANTEAGATPIITAPSVTCNGTEAVLISFSCAQYECGTANQELLLYLYDGTTSLGLIFRHRFGDQMEGTFVQRRITPSLGAHVFSIRGSKGTTSAGNTIVRAGPGGSAQIAPAWMRVISADQIGAQGPPGSVGPAGPTGLTGPTGPPGATGPVGPQGPLGPNGADSTVPGPPGQPGPPGPTGPQGNVGPQGPQGATGIQGPAGTGIVFRGQVATVAALPPTGNSVGDAYTVIADGNLYVWDGTKWTNAGPFQGPAGPSGPQGPAGTAGTPGSTGPQGAPGPTGATGSQGPTGPQGATGPQGPIGPVGANGNDGAPGQLLVVTNVSGLPASPAVNTIAAIAIPGEGFLTLIFDGTLWVSQPKVVAGYEGTNATAVWSSSGTSDLNVNAGGFINYTPYRVYQAAGLVAQARLRGILTAGTGPNNANVNVTFSTADKVTTPTTTFTVVNPTIGIGNSANAYRLGESAWLDVLPTPTLADQIALSCRLQNTAGLSISAKQVAVELRWRR